jgi:PAS domain S-box-containing protein
MDGAGRIRQIAGPSPGRLTRARRLLGGLKLEALIVALLLATFAAINYQHVLLDRTLVYSPANRADYNAYSFGDQNNGGNSTVTPDAAGPLSWTCELRPAYQYPYCGYGLLFDLQNDGHGLNLAQFRSITIDISYEGPSQSVRLDLKNRDAASPGIAPTQGDRVNSTEFAIRDGAQTIELSLSSFQVASWWIAANHVAPAASRPRFDNVTALEVQTGTGARPGRHQVRVRSIALNGTLLSAEQYYSGIFGIWVVIIGLVLVHRRRRARDSQRNEIVRWRKTMDTIPQMVWSLASHGDEYHNDQWTDFTGVVMGSAGGPRHSDLIHPDDRAQVVARWQRSLESGAPFEAEYRMRHRSEGYRYVLSRASAERDETGAVARWYGTCTDIHDRILAQQELWRSQNFTRQLVEATPDGIIVIDEEGSIVFANAAAAIGLGADS